MSISARATATIKTRPGEKCECCNRAFEHPRNAGRHRAFFAMLAPAFQNWPHKHEFQPLDIDDLRSWLLCKARWCEVERIYVAGANQTQMTAAMATFMRRNRGKLSHFVQTKTGLAAYTPKSIAFTKCREDEFRRIIDDVAGIIETETGISIADMRRARVTTEQPQWATYQESLSPTFSARSRTDECTRS
jgi:hypothetical protein